MKIQTTISQFLRKPVQKKYKIKRKIKDSIINHVSKMLL
jgi:hypothetical protein